MALTFTFSDGTGWPPTVQTGNANTCRTFVFDQISSWINTNCAVTNFRFEVTDGVASGTGPGTGSAKTYSQLIALLASTVSLDAYPNNIKTTAFATLPGYPSAVDSDNPFPTRVNCPWHDLLNAFVTNSDINCDLGFNSWRAKITVDDGVGSPSLPWDATASWTSVPSNGSWGKMTGTLIHEFSHGALGRNSGVDLSSTTLCLADLYMYSGIGTRTLSGSGTRYLSLDGGVTSLGACNQSGTGDFVGFTSDTSVQSPFTSSTLLGVSRAPRFEDVQLFSALGCPLTKTGLIAAGLPNAIDAPSITGTPGGTLTANTGNWSGYGTITKQQWQWQRNGTDIVGATGSTFDSSAEGGNTITVVETASNSIGDNTATSTGVDIPADGVGTFTISGSGSLTPAANFLARQAAAISGTGSFSPAGKSLNTQAFTMAGSGLFVPVKTGGNHQTYKVYFGPH